MTTGLLEGDFAVFKQFDERWPTNPQQIGSFLCRESLMHRSDDHRLALRHSGDDVAQDLEHLGRHRDLLSSGADQRRGEQFVILREGLEIGEARPDDVAEAVASGVDRLSIEPAARIPPTSWSVDGTEFDRDRRRTVALGG